MKRRGTIPLAEILGRSLQHVGLARGKQKRLAFFSNYILDCQTQSMLNLIKTDVMFLHPLTPCLVLSNVLAPKFLNHMIGALVK